MYRRRLVLVTGAPRSGTTPVGQVLGLAKGARYLYEPMHSRVGMTEVKSWFEVEGSRQFPVDQVDRCIEQIASLSFQLKPPINRSNKLILRLIIQYLTGTRTKFSYRLCRLDPFLTTIIWKDPAASFLSRRVAEAHKIPVIVTMRNPLATAASFKRLNWGNKYEHLDDICLRLAEVGFDFSAEMSALRRLEISSARGGATLWHMVYTVFLEWQKQNPIFFLLNTEELVKEPLAHYQALFEFANLEWNDRVERKINSMYGLQSYKAQAPKPGKVHDMSRTAASISEYWRNVLNEDEISFCRDLNDELWNSMQRAASSNDALRAAGEPEKSVFAQ